MLDLRQLEYRVKQKTVYFVTRYCSVGDDGVSLTEEGEFRDPLAAHRAANALLATDHAREGIEDGDARLKGPEPIAYDEPR